MLSLSMAILSNIHSIGCQSRFNDDNTHHASPQKMKTHKDLDVWKEAMTLVKGIYKLTADFPKEEIKSV